MKRSRLRRGPWRRKKNRVCRDCDKEITEASSRCRPCAYKHRKDSTRPPRPCPTCGNLFQPYPSQMRIGAGKYCSKHCYVVVQNRRPAMVERPCDHCGQMFRRTRAAIARAARHFCSRACSSAFIKDHPPEPGKPSRRVYRGGSEPGRGPGWQKLAEQIRLRDGHRCRSCGRTEQENGQRLSVDHIKPWRIFTDKVAANDPSNLVAVCRFCHSRKTSRAEQRYLHGDNFDFVAYERAIAITAECRPEAAAPLVGPDDRVCSRCGIRKQRGEFPVNSASAGGMGDRCKACLKEAYRADATRRREKARLHYQRNREAILTRRRERRQAQA